MEQLGTILAQEGKNQLLHEQERSNKPNFLLILKSKQLTAKDLSCYVHRPISELLYILQRQLLTAAVVPGWLNDRGDLYCVVDGHYVYPVGNMRYYRFTI